MISLHAPSNASDIAAEPRAARTGAAVDVLFTSGAIATLSEEPRPLLVGALQWLDDTHILLFSAHGDAPTDAHELTFDDAIVNPRGSVTFLRANQVVGALHRIDDSDVDDTDDYRIAWQLWQEVAPLRRRMINRCFEALQTKGAAITAADSSPRSGR